MIVKTIVFSFLIAPIIMLGSCSKDKPSKPREHFIKTIQCTYPETAADRHSAFTYDNQNRIKEFTFHMSGQTFLNTFSYNENDLIVQIDERNTNLTTGHVLEARKELKYAGNILNEYISGGSSFIVTYEPARNKYQLANIDYYLNANNNLLKIDYTGSNKLTVNYLSGKGVFRPVHSQIASYILAERLFLYFLDDICAFSQNEISGVTENGIVYTYVSVRDDAGNIIQTDIKRSGALVKRYLYTYELREVE